MPFEELRLGVTNILYDNDITVNERLTKVCELLRKKIDHYDWVGFYFKNGDKDELKLKAFAGEPTEHTIIPFGKGICGQAAVSNKNFIIPDVHAENNYLACNIYVKAEIVIPLFHNGKNIGLLDIDSHTPDPFTEEDEQFLEFVNKKVVEIL